MKIICPLSGILWETEGFTTGHKHLQIPHPIFSSPLKTLAAREIDWQAGRLSELEKKLLFLAVLKSSELVKSWEHPAQPTLELVEKNFLHLLKLTVWKAGIRAPGLELPMFSINQGTSSLDNFHYWLTAWEDGKQAFLDGVIKQRELVTKTKLESYLEARIRTVEMGIQGESEKYLKILAAWAEIAAQFPSFLMEHPVTKEQVHCSAYWKEIISLPMSKLWNYPNQDIKELEDHLIDNLDDISSLYAGALLRRIRKLLKGGTEELELELIELPEDEMFPGQRRYIEQMKEHQGTLDAEKDLAKDAPTEEPKEQNFPTRAKYLVQRIKWNAWVKQQALLAKEQPIDNELEGMS